MEVIVKVILEASIYFLVGFVLVKFVSEKLWWITGLVVFVVSSVWMLLPSAFCLFDCQSGGGYLWEPIVFAIAATVGGYTVRYFRKK